MSESPRHPTVRRRTPLPNNRKSSPAAVWHVVRRTRLPHESDFPNIEHVYLQMGLGLRRSKTQTK